jgi:hypothetical protein
MVLSANLFSKVNSAFEADALRLRSIFSSIRPASPITLHAASQYSQPHSKLFALEKSDIQMGSPVSLLSTYALSA